MTQDKLFVDIFKITKVKNVLSQAWKYVVNNSVNSKPVTDISGYL